MPKRHLHTVKIPAGFAVYMREQAEGAIPNGTPIVKVNSEPEDTHKDGAPGVVVGSLACPPALRKQSGEAFFYFIEWDDLPGTPIGAIASKVQVADS